MNGLLLRAKTQDEFAEREVVGENCYRLPDRFAPGDVIVDVGANIGTFAHACLIRGAEHVLCFEPEPECFHLLEENTRRWGAKVARYQMAVWRDGEGVRLHARRWPYTAMHHTLFGEEPCLSISLDDILRSITPKVRLLKLDCEGAEKPILDGVTSLDSVQEVVGEIHYGMVEPGKEPPSIPWLTGRLTDLGFTDIEIVPDKKAPHLVALFFAKR